jgi:hypothetical protein
MRESTSEDRESPEVKAVSSPYICPMPTGIPNPGTLRLVRILAIVALVVGVASLVLGVIELTQNLGSGVVSLILGVVMLALGFTFWRILRLVRGGAKRSG